MLLVCVKNIDENDFWSLYATCCRVSLKRSPLQQVFLAFRLSIGFEILTGPLWTAYSTCLCQLSLLKKSCNATIRACSSCYKLETAWVKMFAEIKLMTRPQQDIPDYALRSKTSQDWFLIKAVLSSPKKQEEKSHTCKLKRILQWNVAISSYALIQFLLSI